MYYFNIFLFFSFFQYNVYIKKKLITYDNVIYKDAWTTSIFAITLFELLGASGDFCAVQSTCTALLVQSQVLQYQAAEESGLVEQSRAVRLASLSFLEEVKKRGRVKGK